MKTKQKKELASKTESELKTLLKETKATLAQFRLDKTQFKLKNTRSIFFQRKQMAMIQTFLQGKEKKHE